MHGREMFSNGGFAVGHVRKTEVLLQIKGHLGDHDWIFKIAIK